MFGIKVTNKPNISQKNLVSDYDIYSFGEAIHYHSHKFLGAQIKETKNYKYIQFTLWATNVEAVSLVGDFNNWTVKLNPLDKISELGIWTCTLEIDSLDNPFRYQFALHRMNGKIEYINDPYGRASDFSDRLTSILVEDSKYRWADSEWVKRRENTEFSIKPISILKFDLAKHKTSPFSYQELAKLIVNQSIDNGYTHVELKNFFEDLVDLSQVDSSIHRACTNQYQYFAVSGIWGQGEDFKCLVDYCHRNGIGVILDMPYFRVDSCSTLNKLNDYSKNPIRNYYISNLVYWLEEFHIDGFVFESVDYELQNKHPEYFISFVRDLNEVVHSRSAAVLTIAEDQISYPNITKPTYMDGLGFNMKINSQWQKDLIDYSIKPNSGLDLLSLSSTYSFAENHILLLDSVSLSKTVFDQYSKLKLALAYFFTYPGKKTLALSDSLGYESLGLYLADLNDIYKNNESLFETDFRPKCFEWVDNSNEVLSYIRWSKDYDSLILVVLNFSPNERKRFQVGIPKQGFYLEILNSDSKSYEGLGLGNDDGLYSNKEKYNNHNFSLFMDMAPYSAHVFKNVGADLNIMKA